MTYDFILMNPPYDKNLHLKIVEQSIPMLTDKGILVNLSPIRWLQDPLAKYKKNSDYCKFEESVCKKMVSYSVISKQDSIDMFNADINTSLAVQVYKKDNVNVVHCLSNTIIDKVMNSDATIGIPFIKYSEKTRDTFVRIKRVGTGGHGASEKERTTILCGSAYGVFENNVCNGKTVFDIKSEDRRSSNGDANNFLVVCFDDSIKAHNFYNACKSQLFRYFVLTTSIGIDILLNYLPWMGDCKNPRTGLKGYEGEWLDDDFYEYFNITEKEREEIECVMKPYL